MFIVLSLTLMNGCSWSGTSDKGKVIVLKAVENQPENYPTTQGTMYLGKQLEERSHGRIKLQMYAGGQLGQGKTISDAIEAGIIDIDRIGIDVFIKEIPSLEALLMPYVFRDSDHVRKVLDGEIGSTIAQEFEKKDMIVLGYYDSGARSFYATKPIVTPEDLKGLQLRVLPGDLFANMMQTLGATGVPLLYNDVYPKLQTGAVSGAENSTPSYLTSKHFELAKYYTLDEHTVSPEILYISKKAWNQLSVEDQQLLKECSAEAAKYQHKLWAEFTEQSMKALQDKGVTILQPNKELFQKAVEPLYQKYPQHTELIRKIQAVK